MRVQVYRNLHTGNFSVRDKKTRIVIAHVDTITLHNVVFHVSEAGWARVIEENQKHVHAWVEGERVADEQPDGIAVTYNPRKDAQFYEVESEEPIERASMATLAGKYVYVRY